VGARVRVKDDGYLEVVGHGSIVSLYAVMGTPFDEVTVGTLEGVGPAYLHSLRQALGKWRKRRRDPDCRVWLGISRLSEEEFQSKLKTMDGFGLADAVLGRFPDVSSIPPTSPALFFEQERLRVRIEIGRIEKPSLSNVRRQLAPFLERHRATADVAVEEVEDPFDPHEGAGFNLTVDIDRWPPEGATVANAWKLGDEARALLLAKEGDELRRPIALDLLRAGRWDLFRGQPESAWLEAKGAPYDHLGDNWQFELAKDVAAFANSPEGGVIVLGMTTEDRGDGDTIDGYKEFELSRVRRQSYRNYVAQRIYPRVAGFEVHRIEGTTKPGHGLAVLVIPPQPGSSRPFLVQGALAGNELLGAHVLLPVRREDDTALMDASALHARIRLGEQVIAGEKRLA
jgi:Putative DNA-binding domain